MSDHTPGIGHNKPPSPLPLIVVDGLEDRLRVHFAALFERRDETVKMASDWLEDNPGDLDANTAKTGNDVLGQVLALADEVDKNSQQGIRADVGRCLIEATRIVNALFGVEIAGKLRLKANSVSAKVLKFAQDKRDRDNAARIEAMNAERRRQAEEAAKQAETQRQANAALLTKEVSAMTPDEVAAAMELESQIYDMEESAKQAITAPVFVAPQSRSSVIQGDLNTKSHLRGTWVPDIVDPAAVPRQYCIPDMPLIKAAGRASQPSKGQKPTIVIPGVVWQLDEKLSTKRK